MYQTEVIEDKKVLRFLDAVIPVLEDLRAISSNWNGDNAGLEEEQAHRADEAFNAIMRAQELITEINEVYNA